MRFPSINSVARALRLEAKHIDWCDNAHKHAEECGFCDVRLQVYEDGAWALRIGPSDYDLDHRGFWGASCIPRGRFDSQELARELISQCRNHSAA